MLSVLMTENFIGNSMANVPVTVWNIVGSIPGFVNQIIKASLFAVLCWLSDTILWSRDHSYPSTSELTGSKTGYIVSNELAL